MLITFFFILILRFFLEVGIRNRVKCFFYALFSKKLLQFLVFMATCPDFLIKILGAINIGIELGHSIELHTIVLGEIVLNTLHIPLKVVLCIGVTCRSHLRKVNHRYPLKVVDHQIELVKVSVN